jgi:hypothetical protein
LTNVFDGRDVGQDVALSTLRGSAVGAVFGAVANAFGASGWLPGIKSAFMEDPRMLQVGAYAVLGSPTILLLTTAGFYSRTSTMPANTVNQEGR